LKFNSGIVEASKAAISNIIGVTGQAVESKSKGKTN